MRDPWMVRGARRAMTTLALLLAASGAARAQEPTTAKAPDWKLDSETFEGLRARSLGPGVMSGRITCLDGVAGARNTLWVGTAGGGVWRSRDHGTTWKPVFDGHTMSIGAIRVAPSDPRTVVVGTGESWTRNSVGYGDGVYRTRDGGDSWTHLGLDRTERIADVLIHPNRPDTMWVAAVGPLFADGEDRGVYRTTDGGKTWTRTLYVDARTGAADLAIDPQNPDVLYASMWSVRRQPWTFASGGPGSGLYKSVDGGVTWRRLSKGLPEGELGRIGVAVSPARASRLYAVVESKKTAMYMSDDGGESWTRGNDSNTDVTWRPFYFAHVVPDPVAFDRVYKGGLALSVSEDAGRKFSGVGGGGFGGAPYHSDVHALWIDPTDTEYLALGTDGGVYVSSDRGNTWRMCENIPVGQFYHVGVDSRMPYHVYGGLQDNGTWSAPSTRSGGVPNRLWESLLGGDGFWAFPDAKDEDVVYCMYQGGELSRVRLSTGETKDIKPLRGPGEPKLRYNWNAALHRGPSGALYMGSQFLLRTRDMGDTWERISPDLTTNDPLKQQQDKSGGLSVDNSTAENHCTIFAIGESPRDPATVWVGTDDGRLQLTRDAGRTWTDLSARLPGVRANAWITSVEPSPHDVTTCFVTVDDHMRGDFRPHVFVTRDGGRTFTALADSTLRGYAHVVRQDPVNPDLVFVGTEWGLWGSLDGGRTWARIKAGIPAVAVRDLVIHPREGDLVIATHGRGIHIIDDLTPLRSLTRERLAEDVAFLGTRPNRLLIPRQEQRFSGSTDWRGDELPEAAVVTYYLKKRHLIGDLKVEVIDPQGKVLTTIPGGRRRGINRVEWPMRLKGPKLPPAANLVPNFFAFVGPRAPVGTYTVRLTKNKQVLTGTFEVVPDPRSTHTAEDRAAQVELVNRLYGDLTRLTYTVESLQGLRDSARAQAKVLGRAPLAKRLEAFADELETLRGRLVAAKPGGRLTGEEQLREQMGDLYGKVNGYDGRPTAGQLALAGVLEAELDKGVADLDALVGRSLPGLNSGLTAAKRPVLVRETREAWDARNAKTESGGAGSLMGVRGWLESQGIEVPSAHD
ncbi:MAG: hypothetical protein RL721_112 [Candidatus Eisenbacteria bacterium]|jgi:photosystem II stability/assembly factor-like uncharacterized protein